MEKENNNEKGKKYMLNGKENANKKNKQEVKKLNLGDFNLRSVVDYHDEFMDKSKEFSLSWRQQLEREKRPHLR